jgi:PPOX class probable F420-dependent enzyme
MNDQLRAFLEGRRTATLATRAADGQPRQVPICFVLAEGGSSTVPLLLYSPLDEKPKRGLEVRELARVRDILARPEVALLFDRWSEDWDRLAWVRARGIATLVEPTDDPEAHAWVVASLRTKYPQYRSHHLEAAPLIRVAIGATSSWGQLAEGQLRRPAIT